MTDDVKTTGVELCSWPGKSAGTLSLPLSTIATSLWNNLVWFTWPFPPTPQSSILPTFKKEAASNKNKEKLSPDYFTSEIFQISH